MQRLWKENNQKQQVKAGEHMFVGVVLQPQFTNKQHSDKCSHDQEKLICAEWQHIRIVGKRIESKILFCFSDDYSGVNTKDTTQLQLHCTATRSEKTVRVRLISLGEVISVYNKPVHAVPAIIAKVHHVRQNSVIKRFRIVVPHI